MNVPSGEFLVFCAIAALLVNASAAKPWRDAVMLVANLAFLASFSRNIHEWLPYVGFMALGYAGVRAMQGGSRAARRMLFPVLCVVMVTAFIWLKRYTILPEQTFLQFVYVQIGLSYVFFRVLHMIIDAKDDLLPGPVGVVDYLNFSLNFTSLVSGPIQRYQDYHRMTAVEQPALHAADVGVAVERIVIGFFKVEVLSVLLLAVQTDALHALQPGEPLLDRASNAILGAAVYPVYLYFNFSGYMDVVIGAARFLRLVLPENFDHPFSSENFIVFWSRWHITLSMWLKTYVFAPLQIALVRRFPSRSAEPWLGVIAFFVTFFLVGVWHGRTSEFIVFGVLQGGGVAGNKLYQITMARRLGRAGYRALCANPVYRAFARGLTFTWFTFTLFWFWSNWGQMGEYVHAAGATGLIVTVAAVLLGATAVLACLEPVRRASLAWRWTDRPVLLSRYTRTVWCTALVLVTASATFILNLPAPHIVYRAF
ncbi:MAG TPA: MBOAT family O-acyltransferase [Acetobacteraceae bacterium]|jgi:D-alanyl-lipoteichoic acid acyltransferase DltB (MBOAT superfamily)